MMASRGVSVLKFVGTVSLGLLTGVSYTLSTLTVPTLLTLPSASTAARAFESLAATAKTHLRTLASVSASSFFLAFLFSPRPFRHPYLLYTSLLVLSSRLVAADFVAPYLYLSPRATSANKSSSPSAAAAATASGSTAAARKDKKKEAAARARMEASYEVLGSDFHSDGTSASGEEADDDATAASATALPAAAQDLNGEEVRGKVENFLKRQMVQTTVAGLGFLMAVVGIWGDGVAPVYSESLIIEI